MQHLDEGTIHAWLDGQLPRDEAASVEAHVAECRQCADAVAEARGLIAASSRILTALDSVPREVLPKQPTFHEAAETASADVVASIPLETRNSERARRSWFRGGWMAAAAVIVVAVGTVTVMRRGGNDMMPIASRPVAATASGPSVDSAPAAFADKASARSEPAKESLGIQQPVPLRSRVAAAPEEASRVPAPSNETQRAASGGVRDNFAAANRQEARRVAADSAANSTPTVPTVRVERQLAASLAKKEVDESKDVRQGAQKQLQVPPSAPAQNQAIVLRGSSSLVKADTQRADKPQPAADAVAAKTAPSSVALGAARGRITDANNTGLSGVMVSVAGTSTGVVTNTSGEYSLGGLQAGSARLIVRRIGYQQVDREITVTAGQTVQTDVVLSPSQTALNEVVVTGAASSAVREKSARAAPAAPPSAPPVPSVETPPGAPLTAAQSNAAGCYELGITGLTATRNTFRQIPRRIALDTEIVPSNADGVWYRARDLARTGAVPMGLWRPTGPGAIQLEFTYGSRTATVRVAGPAGSMMRGTVEEIDRAAATGDAANVVAIRRSCEP